MNIRQIRGFVVAALASALVSFTHANDKGPITLLVGFAPGGTSDLAARVIAQHLPGKIGRPVIVQNRAGALGTLSVRELITTADPNSAFVVLPFSSLVFPVLTRTPAPFDLFKDIQPVASIASFPLAVAVNAGTGVRTPQQLVSWMQKNPKSAIFGTAGAGGHNHFLGIQLGTETGVASTVVPYKGNAPMMADLVPGHIPAAVMVAGEVVPQLKEGRIQLIGVLTQNRSPLMPDVPTFAEQGVNLTSGESWYGIWASSKADKAQVQLIQDAIRKVLDDKDVKKSFEEKLALQPDFKTAEQTDARLRRDHAYWAPIIKASGFKAD